jgi:transposase
VVPPRLLASHAGRSGGSRLGRRDRRSGFDLHQGAPLCSWRQRGAKSQAIGVSRGGQTTKVHVITDVLGRPAVIHLTPGNASDIKAAPEVIAAAPGRLRRLLADRGYDADALRRDLRAVGTMPVIPGRRTRKRPIHHDNDRYKDRWRIEAAFCRLKDFRRIATRYDKLAANFASAVALATVVAFWC